MRIVLTNDDGIHAPGLAALYRAVSELGELRVVAPFEPRSAVSHAVTFHKSMVVQRCRIDSDAGGVLFEGHAVSGHPADCVKIGLHNLVPKPVDLVISGINAGANIGVNVIYSGTVAAAREAAIQGVAAIAVSLHIGDPAKTRWDLAAKHARLAIERIIAMKPRPGALINVNIPILDGGDAPAGWRVVPMATNAPMDDYVPDAEQEGLSTQRAATGLRFHGEHAGSDVDMIFKRFVTITPLEVDQTNNDELAHWRAIER